MHDVTSVQISCVSILKNMISYLSQRQLRTKNILYSQVDTEKMLAKHGQETSKYLPENLSTNYLIYFRLISPNQIMTEVYYNYNYLSQLYPIPERQED